MKFRLIGLGMACLVLSALFDNLRGPLLPALAERFALGYGKASLFMAAGTAGSIAMNLLSVRLLDRLGERLFALLGASLLGSAATLAATAGAYGLLLAAGALWGAGLSALGLGANLFVVEGSTAGARARTLSALHVFFGLSSVFPPVYLAHARSAGWGWEGTLLAPLALLVPFAAAAAVLAPGRRPRSGASNPPARLFPVPLPALGLAVYVVAEVLVSTWMVSYLGWRGLGPDSANRHLSAFFLCLGGSRALFAALGGPRLERLAPSVCPLAAALLLAAGLLGSSWALPASGFAMGPIFPTAVAAISYAHPERTRSLMSAVYALFTVGLAVGHPLVGAVADRWTMGAAYLLAPSLLLLSAPLLARSAAR